MHLGHNEATHLRRSFRSRPQSPETAVDVFNPHETMADEEMLTVAGIREAPDDVLLSIFGATRSLEASESQPRRSMVIMVAISQVDRRWRELSLSTPSLWCFIDIQPPPHPPRNESLLPGRFFDLYERETRPNMPPEVTREVELWRERGRKEISRMNAFRTRSGDSPVSIRLTVAERVTKANFANLIALYDEYFDILLSFSGRWESLDVDMSMCDDHIPSVLRLIDVSPVSTPALRSISFHMYAPGTSSIDMFRQNVKQDNCGKIMTRGTTTIFHGGEFSALTSVSLSLPWKTIAQILNVLPTCSIRELILEPNPQLLSAGLMQHEAVQVLEHFPNLVRCAMRLHEGMSEADHLRQIQALAQGAQNASAQRLLFPNRQPPPVADAPELLSHSRLEELVLLGGAQPCGLAARLTLPSLTSLSLVHSMPSSGPFADGKCGAVEWMEAYGTQLAKVVLGCATLTPVALERCLRALHGVEDLTLLGQDITNPDLAPILGGIQGLGEWGSPESFLPLAVISSDVVRILVVEANVEGAGMEGSILRRVNCPKLRRLECWVETLGEEGTLEQAFVDFIAARRPISDGHGGQGGIRAGSDIREVVLEFAFQKSVDIEDELAKRGVRLEDFRLRVEYGRKELGWKA